MGSLAVVPLQHEIAALVEGILYNCSFSHLIEIQIKPYHHFDRASSIQLHFSSIHCDNLSTPTTSTTMSSSGAQVYITDNFAEPMSAQHNFVNNFDLDHPENAMSAYQRYVHFVFFHQTMS